MSFAAPGALVLLVALPLGVVGLVLLDRRRRRDAARFSNPALSSSLVTRRPGARRAIPSLLVLAALGLLVVGIARPHIVRTVTNDEATVVLAIDTSRSMAATDVQPTRFEAARAAVNEFLDNAPDNYRVGIVAFSTFAEAVLPPTTDREAARQALRELRLGSGTAIGDAIVKSLELAGDEPGAKRPRGRPPAVVLLLSDGAQTTDSVKPIVAAARARRLGIPVSTVALGTEDAVVVVPVAGGLNERVRVPPDAPTLKRVAQATGGTFFETADAGQLREVYRDLGTRLTRERKPVEVTSAFALGGAALALLAGVLSMAWFRRAL